MKKIFISAGDVNGIGPELIIKTLSDPKMLNGLALVIAGNREIFDQTSASVAIPLPEMREIEEAGLSDISETGIYFVNIDAAGLKLEFGHPSAEAGRLAGESIKKAARFAHIHSGALLTAPINKYSLHLGGFFYPGHTEFIASLLNSPDHLMILDGGVIKVALVTTHLALKDVPGALNAGIIFEKGRLLYRSLARDYRIREPRITVCSLNPHGGDGGLFGNEEKDIISVAVDKLNSEIARGIGHFSPPIPSDTAFTRSWLEKTDAYLVMYHDQGLIPLKLLSFGTAVNFTAGLPIVRTSPDHGTAYDIAGKGKADTSSFENALKKAVFFMNNRDIQY